jgi:glutathione S-transferase
MTIEFHGHPLSSFCWKVLIALYELEAPFESGVVNLGDPGERAAFLKLSPFGKIPALRDTDRGAEVYETSIMVDYLDQHYPGPAPLIPADRDAAREVRLRDRVFDLHVHNVFQQIINDRLRPEGARDPLSVERARGQLREAYDVLERDLAGRTWAAGEAFSLADCAAAPALFYADLIEPMGEGRPVLAAYLRRLRERPSVARAIAEARPFFQYYPATPEERERLAAQGLG